MVAMRRIKRKYWGFYLDGRAERRLRTRSPIDPAAIAKGLLEQEDGDLFDGIRTAVHRAADEALTPRIKKQWLAAHDEAIREEECDPEEAYGAWCQGRIDELASAHESAVIDALSEQVLEDE